MRLISLLGLSAGAFALAVMAPASSQTTAPKSIKLCTGSDSGKYYEAGQRMSSMAGTKNFSIDVETSDGTWDNIQRVLLPPEDPNSCDAFIGQPDGAVVLKRTKPGDAQNIRAIMPLHREYLHVLCHKDTISDLDQVDKSMHIAVGANGSGGWLIWQNFIEQDKSYAEIPVTNEGGSEGLSAVASGDATCMLRPAAAGDGIVAMADSSFGDVIDLVGATDKDFNDAVDLDGTPLYSFVRIPTTKYVVTFGKGWGSDPKTVSWNAKLYINKNKVKGKDLDALIEAARKARTGILADFGK